MSAPARDNGLRAPSAALDTPDLDVTPIMNMFVILVPFLVSMAVFTHLAVIEFTLPPNVGAGLSPAAGQPRVKMTAVVAADRVRITLGDRELDSVSLTAAGVDAADLAARITALRPGIEIKDEAVVAVRDRVRFKHVVKVMDACRSAGFTKIGLSSATEDPDKGV